MRPLKAVHMKHMRREENTLVELLTAHKHILKDIKGQRPKSWEPQIYVYIYIIKITCSNFAGKQDSGYFSDYEVHCD